MINAPLPMRQQGAALIVGLLLLIVVTLVAISGIKSTSMQQSLATNMQERMTVYQTAESLIRQLVNRVNSTAALVPGDVHLLVTALNRQVAGQIPIEVPLANPPAGLTGNAIFSYTGATNAPGFSMGVGTSGVFVAHRYLIDSFSDMAAANTQANNQQGLMHIAPAP